MHCRGRREGGSGSVGREAEGGRVALHGDFTSVSVAGVLGRGRGEVLVYSSEGVTVYSSEETTGAAGTFIIYSERWTAVEETR